MKKVLHVFYSGRVQGVGFRFTAQRIAQELNISGWAKNLSDGRVEIAAEAEEEILKNFLSQMGAVFARYIQDVEARWEPASGELCGFNVRF